MRISDWSSDVCSSDLRNFYQLYAIITQRGHYCHENTMQFDVRRDDAAATADAEGIITDAMRDLARWLHARLETEYEFLNSRSEEHTSELQSLMRISYAVFCLNKKQYVYNYIH